MSRIKINVALLGALVAVTVQVAAQTEINGTPSTAEPDKRPNIIVILADDLGYGSLGCYGSTEIKTPNIDRLAASGVRFTDFHSNGTVCSPTRAALLTGRYPQRCAWVGDEELSPVFREQRKENPRQRWAWGIATNELTIATLLRQAGYRTGIIGKWHLGYDFKFHPMNYGFDEFRGFVGGNVDYHTHVAGYGLKQIDWWNGKQIENEKGYTTDLLTSHATDFIARNKDKPFFLYLTHAAPHEPWQGRDPINKKSPGETYKEMIQILDESVGTISDELRKHRLETNTLLIFCSDNGAAPPPKIAANGRLQGRKGSMSEGGHRVPCIASWPGVIVAGAIHEEAVMTMDFFPTFAKLAGVKPPQTHQIDGIDLMPCMKGETKKTDRALHWLFGDSWAVRKGAWKLTGRGENSLTLGNLENDIEEKGNHIKEQPELVNELVTLHRQWIESVGSR
jgi:arylsulfatase A-like enzyme